MCHSHIWQITEKNIVIWNVDQKMKGLGLITASDSLRHKTELGGRERSHSGNCSGFETLMKMEASSKFITFL